MQKQCIECSDRVSLISGVYRCRAAWAGRNLCDQPTAIEIQEEIERRAAVRRIQQDEAVGTSSR